MRRTPDLRLSPLPAAWLVLAGLPLISACTTQQQMRMELERLDIDHFYTTSYSGEVRWRYEAIFRNPRGNQSDIVKLRNPPPRVSRFRAGERICVAIHSYPGEKYRYHRVGLEREPGTYWVRGSGKPVVSRADIHFSILSVGSSSGGWEVTCTQKRPGMRMSGSDWDKFYQSPQRWTWVDNLKPGSYTVRIRIKEPRIERTYTKEASFTVE